MKKEITFERQVLIVRANTLGIEGARFLNQKTLEKRIAEQRTRKVQSWERKMIVKSRRQEATMRSWNLRRENQIKFPDTQERKMILKSRRQEATMRAWTKRKAA